jgi:hypothetical protein
MFVVTFEVVQLSHFPMVTPIEGATWDQFHRHSANAKGVQLNRGWAPGLFNLVVWGDTIPRNTHPNCAGLWVEAVRNEIADSPVQPTNGIT